VETITVPKSNDPCWCGSGKKFKRCHKVAPVRNPSVLPGEISPIRTVPNSIVAPDYVTNGGRPKKNSTQVVKDADTIQRMRIAGRAAARVIEIVRPHVQVGVTTDEIDAIAHQAYIDLGGYPSTVGYGGYPKSVCTSVNEVICHGIPDSRPLRNGDILNVDVTIYLNGVHGDASVMFELGEVDEVSHRLVTVTKECLDLAIEAVKPGLPINVIGKAIETHATQFGFGVVRAFVGHGIGEVFHMPPNVPHYFDRRVTTPMVPGMTFTIEPMITASGSFEYDLWDDDWTAVTHDLSRTAQWEHTILVTETGAEILTVLDPAVDIPAKP
jgi:methionyl aminopeptidase